MLKLPLILASILISSALAGAANWYVDADTAINGNGTSWATAWRQLTNVSWSAMSPGDTLWVSGGNYYGRVSPSKAGTAGNPIRIKKSQETGHNDHATLYGYISTAGNYIWIDGARSDSYTNQITSTFSVWQITNNIGFTITREPMDQVTAYPCINIFNSTSQGPKNFRAIWLEMTSGPTMTNEIYCEGVKINAGDIDRCEIAYNWIHDTISDAIVCKTDKVWETNSISVHHNLCERIGDDGIVVNGGADVHHNIIHDFGTSLGVHTGHPDGIICVGTPSWIYNNMLWDWNTEPMYPSILRQTNANMYIYGNLVYSDDNPEHQSGAINFVVDGSFPWEEPDGQGGYVYTTNAWYGPSIWANNSFIAGRAISDPHNAANRYSPSSGNAGGIKPGLIVTLTNWLVANNIFLEGNSQAANFKDDSTGFAYHDSDLRVENNVFASTIVNGRRVGYNSTNYYANAEAMDAATGTANNTSSFPKFEDFEGRDFHLTSADTAARGKGRNLAYTGLPGIEYDVFGTYRGTGAWDIGAVAYVSSGTPDPPDPPDTNLLLHLTFEDNFPSNGYAADTSGNNSRMLRYGWSDWKTNFPTIGVGRVGNQSAKFLPYYSTHPWGNEFFDGQFGAVTNVGSMTSMTQSTFAAWVKFGVVTYADQTLNHNASILNAGYGVKGSWGMGRIYSTTYGEPQFRVLTNAGAGSIAGTRSRWPQIINSWWYTNGAWIHLAATVNCSTPTNLLVNLYMDGTNVARDSFYLPVYPVQALRISDASGSIFGEWIGVGVGTHNGTPPLGDSDDLPNNGWLNGELDDIRIYNRILSDKEISEIAGGSSPEPPDPPDPPDPPPVEPPAITVQPQSITRKFKEPAEFSVVASGSDLAYQWFKNGVSIGGATARIYSIAKCEPGDAGNYNVTVSNPDGQAISSLATLTVIKKGNP